ncbi:MAG TPA: hypothetical protein VKZ60_13775 [Chloroflexota bacterium]|jgi:hypothetical protein|nr:hypothetical protein [Chloroflexota bacterium]
MRALLSALLLAAALFWAGGSTASAQLWFGYPGYPYPLYGYPYGDLGYPFGAGYYPYSLGYYPLGGPWPYAPWLSVGISPYAYPYSYSSLWYGYPYPYGLTLPSYAPATGLYGVGYPSSTTGYVCTSPQGQIVIVSNAMLTTGYTDCIPYSPY